MGKRRKKILIVEDERLLAFFMAEYLKKDGYDIVATVSSGEAAIELTDSHKPDLIIMDVFLDGKTDGIEATRYINTHHALPVIYITGNTDMATYERANNTKHYGYYEKPISSKRLLKAVKETFELVKQKEESSQS